MEQAADHVALMQGITESLRLLALEARHKQPVIKDAAERATLRLRNFLTRHKPLTSRTVEDALQPLLLAVNHQNGDEQLLTIAINAIQRLVVSTSTELTTSQLQNIVRVLRIQAEGSNRSLQLRVLQTLPLLLTPGFFHSDDSLMATTTGICFSLITSADPMYVVHPNPIAWAVCLRFFVCRLACMCVRCGRTRELIAGGRGDSIHWSVIRSAVPTRARVRTTSFERPCVCCA